MNVLEARRRLLGADVKKKTAEGNPISVRSLARMHPGLSVMGKSTQRTTTGAQLGNLPDLEPTEKKGITWSCNGGVVTVNGTATENSNTLDILYSDVPIVAGEYFSSGTTDHVSVYVEVVKDGVVQYKSGHFTLDGTETSMRFYLMVSKGYTINNVVVYPMLNAGSTALPWEPYTGGQPSPSPDYPQEISSVGDDGSIQVTVGGRNLFDISKAGYFAVNSYGMKVERQGEYLVISGICDAPESLNLVVAFLLCGIDKDFYGKYFWMYIEEHQNINLNYKPSCYADKGGFDINISFKLNANNTYTYLKFKLMVTEETGTFPYEPYKQPQILTIQTPNGLLGIPVDSGGNYTDESGQQWVCDEIDFKRGKYVQRVSKVVVDGVNVKFEDNNTGFWNLPNFTAPGINQAAGVPYSSNYFPEYIFGGNLPYDFIFTMDENINPYFSSDDELNAFCAEKYTDGQPLEIYYPMDPIETDLTQEQMEAYASLHTNRPTTIITATDGAGLKLTYKTKKSLEVAK